MLGAIGSLFVNRRLRLCFVATGALAVALLLAGCGRKGALDPPPAASATGETRIQQEPLKTDSTGTMIAPKGPIKKIPPDWLID